jgi:glycosyltransferase involved in cell wall biosynthesis
MKIAVNTRFLLPNKLEGIGYFTYEVLKRMVLAHPEHEFIFFFDRPYDARFVFADNIMPVVLSPLARHPFLFYIWFEWSVARALKKYKADVFLSPDNFLSLNTKVPTVLVVHDIAYAHFSDNDTWISRQYYRNFMPRFVQKAAHILTVSTFTKEDIVEQYPYLNRENITVCYNGCRDNYTVQRNAVPLSQILTKNTEGVAHQRNSVPLHDSDTYFLYVGAVHPRKNVHRLIEAFDIYKKQSNTATKLVICGRFAWQTGTVKSAYDAAIFKKDIIFTGYINDDDLASLTASALAMVYVSLFEGFGVPLLEAMHCDVPIITSDRTSMPEVAGEAAILVNPESVEAIAKAMENVEKDPILREKLIENGRLQRLKFSWEKTAAVVYEALSNVIKGI